jgi:hypothetical protein
MEIRKEQQYVCYLIMQKEGAPLVGAFGEEGAGGTEFSM